MATIEKMIVVNTIFSQIGFMTRGCLDMRGRNCYATENGMMAKNVIVGPSKRGDIEITVNGSDLYDIKVTRRTNRESTVLHDWKDVHVSDLRTLLNTLWR